MKSLSLIYLVVFALLTSCSSSSRNPAAQTKKPRHVIITVHGLSGNEKTWGSFKPLTEHFLEEVNPKYRVQVSNFLLYPTGQTETLSTFDFADSLNAYIEKLFESEPITPEDKISLVAHSQGGLISYIWYSHVADDNSEQKYIRQVDSIITLGTPFWGSKIASILTDKRSVDIIPLVKLFGGEDFQMSRRELVDLAFGSDTVNKFREFAVKMDNDPSMASKLEKLPIRLVNIIGLLPKNEQAVFANKDMAGVSKLTKEIVGKVYDLFKGSESDIAVSVPSGRWNFIYAPPHQITEKTSIGQKEFKNFSHLLDRSKFIFAETVHLPFEGDSTLSMAYINKSCEVVENCNHPTYRYILEHLADCKDEICNKENFVNIINKMKLVSLNQHEFNKKIAQSLKTFSIQIAAKMPAGTINKFPVKYFHQKSNGDSPETPSFELYEPNLVNDVLNLNRDKNSVSTASTPDRKILIGSSLERRTIDIFSRISQSASEDGDLLRISIIGSVESSDQTQPFNVPITLKIWGMPEVKIDAVVQTSYSTFVGFKIIQNSSMKTYAFKLSPGQDLKQELAQYCKNQKIQAGCLISSVGSLKTLSLRLANSRDVLSKEGLFEILTLNGTLSEDGLHLHLAVADSEGRCIGGHLKDGNLIHTTCEIVIADLPGMTFTREHDPLTGFKELTVTKK